MLEMVRSSMPCPRRVADFVMWTSFWKEQSPILRICCAIMLLATTMKLGIDSRAMSRDHDDAQ
jgi:hypothetical protein